MPFQIDISFIFRLKTKQQLKKSFGHVVHYNILTKLALFKRYLISAENIEVKLCSGTSNVDIGQAICPIPFALNKFIDESTTKAVGKFRSKCHILNAQNRIMGEIVVDYELALYDRIRNGTEVDKEIITNTCSSNGIENDMNHFNLDLVKSLKNPHNKKSKRKSPNKRFDEQKTQSKRTESLAALIPTSVSSSKQLTSKSSSSSLFDYLTGQPLAASEESVAIKEMESTSPTQSLVDLLSFDLNGLYQKKITNNEQAILQKIDCLRIHVYELCLTRAGIREILSQNAVSEFSFSSGTFTVEIALDSILNTKSPFEKKNCFTSKVTRIFSSSVEAVPPSKSPSRSTIIIYWFKLISEFLFL